MTQYLSHTVIEGQRWDWLAWHYYYDVNKASLLIEENPHAPIAPTLPAGLVLRIPLIEPAQAARPEGTPPWK